MKIYVKNTTLYTIAFLFFFFGNAVNVIRFCCDVCRVQGTQVFTESVCHQQPVADRLVNFKVSDPEKQDGTTCRLQPESGLLFHITHQHEACSLNRVSITLDGFLKNLKVKPWALTSLLFSKCSFNNLAENTSTVSDNSFLPSAIPLTGRQLLNKICVLRN